MKDFFEKYKIGDEKIAVGVSGGADSLALVLWLKECGREVVALTVEHGLREESAREAEYVAELMRQYEIEHHILRWVGDKPKTGIEEAARQARYDLMLDFCHKNKIGILATGHHLRDQAETFLLRLQRGSGVFGLSGILPVSTRDNIVIIRPQLGKTPEELQQYLLKRNVKWVADPMNLDDDFVRVKIRKFLPELAKIAIDEKRLAETAATIGKTRAFLQRLVDEFIKTQVRNWQDIVVNMNWHKLKQLDIEVSMLVLGQLLQKVGGTTYMPEADELMRVLTSEQVFKGCTLGKCELFIATKRLWIVPQDEKKSLMTKADWIAFAAKFPIYNNAGLPYKVRRALWQRLKG